MSNTEKFTGRAAIYAKFRPDYPDALIHDLIDENNLDGSSLVADIGSGTGILTKQLLESGLRVMAVEPNAEMRHIAETQMEHDPQFISVPGSAEQTGLDTATVDLITVAQAFHWFDPNQFKKECQRVLKSDGKVTLIWNSRVVEAPLFQESETICRKFCADFDGFSGGIGNDSSCFDSFFRDGECLVRTYNYPLEYHLENFIGRHLSASYAPKTIDPNYQPFIDALTWLFQKYSKDGLIAFPNVTRCYSGQV